MLRNTENKMELWVTVLQFCFLLVWIENVVKDISEKNKNLPQICLKPQHNVTVFMDEMCSPLIVCSCAT